MDVCAGLVGVQRFLVNNGHLTSDVLIDHRLVVALGRKLASRCISDFECDELTFRYAAKATSCFLFSLGRRRFADTSVEIPRPGVQLPEHVA